MPTAKKLPSGSWRVRVFVGRDKQGKQVTRSFTAETKREAERLAAQFVTEQGKTHSAENATVRDCMREYIGIKEATLSPSTIRAYRSLERTAYNSIGEIRINRLKKVDLQRWVGEYAVGHSPKRVSNAYGLLTAVLALYDIHLGSVTLPTRYGAVRRVPSDADVSDFLKYIQKTRKDDNDLYIAVMLAAYGCMRRSEICALTADDIDRENNTVRVNKAMILTEDREWIVKPPKTPGSVRTVTMPKQMMDILPVTNGRVIQATPDQISHRFERAIISSGIRRFRFHDLRHYAASAMHAAGIRDQYIMQRGGWITDGVMKRVYRGTISEEEARANAKIDEWIAGALE